MKKNYTPIIFFILLFTLQCYTSENNRSRLIAFAAKIERARKEESTHLLTNVTPFFDQDPLRQDLIKISLNMLLTKYSKNLDNISIIFLRELEQSTVSPKLKKAMMEITWKAITDLQKEQTLNIRESEAISSKRYASNKKNLENIEERSSFLTQILIPAYNIKQRNQSIADTASCVDDTSEIDPDEYKSRCEELDEYLKSLEDQDK